MSFEISAEKVREILKEIEVQNILACTSYY
jgi:hypothetical protein